MKRITLLLLALLVAAQALAFPLQHRRKNTTTIVSGIPAVTVATGKITANGCDGATVTCQCAGVNATASLDACESESTAVAEAPDGTGHYELTIDSTDIDGEKCVYKIVCGAGILDHIIEVDTAEYLSYENITSMTATQPAVVHTGNTTGQGELITGGNAASAVLFTGTGSNGAISTANGTGPGLFIKSTYNTGAALQIQNDGTGYAALIRGYGNTTYPAVLIDNDFTSGGAALQLEGGSSATTAGGKALNLVGGASTWANVGGNGGDAITATAGASHATATTGGHGASFTGTGPGQAIRGVAGATGVTVLLSSTAADVLQLTATGGNSDAIQLTGYGTGLALHVISGNGADGSLDRLLQRRDSTL